MGLHIFSAAFYTKKCEKNVEFGALGGPIL